MEVVETCFLQTSLEHKTGDLKDKYFRGRMMRSQGQQFANSLEEPPQPCEWRCLHHPGVERADSMLLGCLRVGEKPCVP